MRSFFSCLFLFFSFSLYAQTFPVGAWKNFTSMKEVRSVLLAGNDLYVATSGGLFTYNTETAHIRQYNNSDGLPSNDLQSLGIDGAGNIWIGATNGAIARFEPATEQWESFSDIQSIDPSRWTQRTIRAFIPSGNLLYITTSFGITVFRLQKKEFGDTYSDFGFTGSPIITTSTIYNNRLWVGSTAGVATAQLDAPNLISPTAWNRPALSGLSSTSVTSFAVLRDTLLVSTSSGIAAFVGGNFLPLSQFSGMNILQMSVAGDSLYVLQKNGSSFSLLSIHNLSDVPSTLATETIPLTSFAIGNTGFYLGTQVNGVLYLKNGERTFLLPNGPASNVFSSLVVDDNGVLWAASRPAYGFGFYRFNPELPDTAQWKNFASDEYPLLRKNGNRFDDYYWVSRGANNSIWISSWGNGVVEVRGDTLYRRLDYFSTPSLPGAVNENPPAYVVTGAVAVDKNGKTWITNRVGYSGRSLLRLDSDTSATYFDNELNPSEALFHGLWIDENNTKWMANSVPSDLKQPGLYYLNEEHRISGTTAGGWGRLTTADGLPSNTILFVTGDLEGNVWIGTSAGVSILYDPLVPSRRSSSYVLRDRVIQTIAVDGSNNKWIGTKEGVLVVNADGSELLAQYSTTTTRGLLPSNDVRSIAIDSKRGIAYFGTELGLSALGIPSVAPQRNYSTLHCSPQPFVVPSETQLIIRNLVANSSIKIFTVSGILVKAFPAQGAGRAFWDGTDENGNVVPSGVYIVFAYSPEGNKAVAGKIAVIRR